MHEDRHMLVLHIVVEIEPVAEQPGNKTHSYSHPETRHDFDEWAAAGHRI
jgi:hypothetical protein